MATILLVPKAGTSPPTEKMIKDIGDESERCRQRNIPFIITLEGYEIYSTIGDVVKVEADENGIIRMDLNTL